LHDEYKDLIFLFVVLFAFIIAFTIVVGYRMEGDWRQVNTLISTELKYKH